ncbi:MAG: hypothetical protein WAO93_02280 [Orrella sp.]
MNELASYSIQAIVFAAFAVFVISRSKKTDLYQFSLILVWLVGVVVIYARYGEGQVLFYSNDQEIHQRIVINYIDFFGISLGDTINFRYIITLPVYLISKLGFHEILLFKYLQLFALIGIYSESKKILMSNGVNLRLWHALFIASPVMIFFSTLALRDVILAYLVLFVVFRKRVDHQAIAAGVIFLLRPHLAIALLVGFLTAHFVSQLRIKLAVLTGAVNAAVLYFVGAMAYPIGSIIRDNFDPGQSGLIFSQPRILQVVLNFTGLQFLSQLDDDGAIVASSVGQLIAARLLLIDTFIIPFIFALLFIFSLRRLKLEAIFTASSFIFFLGLVTQTDFNSTRQNLPFYALMGIICVVNLSRPATNPNPELRATRVG